MTRGPLYPLWLWWSDFVFGTMWLWQPLTCWIRGHENDSYGRCVWCRHPMKGDPDEDPT